MRRNLFWKLALTFIALLAGVLLAVNFFAERALYRVSEHATFDELAILARFSQLHPPDLQTVASGNTDSSLWSGTATEILNHSLMVLSYLRCDRVTQALWFHPRNPDSWFLLPKPEDCIFKELVLLRA